MEKILIHSYKGGTGKTTIAINTAGLLSRDKKVLLVENDFLMPSFYDIFKRDHKYYFNDYFNNYASFDDIIINEIRPNLDAIFTNKKFNPNEKVMGSDQEWFLTTLETLMEDIAALKGMYDYIIFDTPPGWHLIVVNLIMLSSKAILILRPNSFAVEGTKRMIDILYKRAKPMRSWEVFLLFNQVPEVDMMVDLDKWSSEFENEDIRYAGHISCSCNNSYQMAHEATIFPPEHEFNRELQKALEILL
ncbi:MAG: MinD/ParA family ATP-binding protein [Candidatus Hodarchaeales archaeon]